MKKSTLLLFIPLLFTLACKKENPTIVKEEIVPVKEIIPFKDVILTNYKETIEFKMNDASDIAYLGYVTNQENVTNRLLNPLVGAGIINSEVSLKDVNGVVLKTQVLDISDLSTYREGYNAIMKNANSILSPKISYALYAPVNFLTASKTNVTLVLKATYFYMDQNPVKDENIKLYKDLQKEKVKESGAYLSRIGYGLSVTYDISSNAEPKVFIPALEAYLNDQLNNKGDKANDLKKPLATSQTSVTYTGGPMDEWFKKSGLVASLGQIEDLIKQNFVPKAQNAFGQVGFEFSSLKDGGIVK